MSGLRLPVIHSPVSTLESFPGKSKTGSPRTELQQQLAVETEKHRNAVDPRACSRSHLYIHSSIEKRGEVEGRIVNGS